MKYFNARNGNETEKSETKVREHGLGTINLKRKIYTLTKNQIVNEHGLS